MKLKIYFYIIPLLIFISQSAYSQVITYDNSFELSVSGSYLYSNSNYNGAGAVFDLPSGNQMNDLHSTFAGRILVNPDWAFSGGLSVAYILTKGSDAQRTNSGISGYHLATDYRFHTQFAELIPSVQVFYPAEKVDEASDSAINSDGSMRVDFLFNVQKKISSTMLFGHLGYAYRDQGRSNLLPWSAGVLWNLNHFELGGRIFGFQSISDDKDTGVEYNRLTFLNKVNAGSYLYYSINPSVVDIEALLNYNLIADSKLVMAAGFTLMGNNYSQNYHVSASLVFGFGDSGPSGVRKKIKSIDESPVEAVSSEKKVNNFKEDTSDGVDQNIFKVKPIEEELKPVQPKTQSLPDEDLKSQLDSVEMTIELKSSKGKKKKKKKNKKNSY